MDACTHRHVYTADTQECAVCAHMCTLRKEEERRGKGRKGQKKGIREDGRASYVLVERALQPLASKPEKIPASQGPETPQQPGPSYKEGALPLGLLLSDTVAT